MGKKGYAQLTDARFSGMSKGEFGCESPTISDLTDPFRRREKGQMPSSSGLLKSGKSSSHDSDEEKD